MRAILINPFAQTIEKVDHVLGEDGSGLQDIYAKIECDTIDVVRVDEDNVMYVDDNGLYKKDQRFWEWEGFPHRLAGRALITGIDQEENNCPSTTKLDEVLKAVKWLPETVKFQGLDDRSEDVEIFGKPGFKITRTAKWSDR